MAWAGPWTQQGNGPAAGKREARRRDGGGVGRPCRGEAGRRPGRGLRAGRHTGAATAQVRRRGPARGQSALSSSSSAATVAASRISPLAIIAMIWARAKRAVSRSCSSGSRAAPPAETGRAKEVAALVGDPVRGVEKPELVEPVGAEAGLFRKLARGHQRRIGAGPGLPGALRKLPEPPLHRVAKLPHELEAAVRVDRHDQHEILLVDHAVDPLGPVGKADRVFVELHPAVFIDRAARKLADHRHRGTPLLSR